MKSWTIVFGCFLFVTGACLAQDRSAQARGRTRDVTPVQPPEQGLDAGLLKRSFSPGKPLTLRGLLIDAGCVDRSTLTLLSTPHLDLATAPAPKGDATPGLKVDKSTVTAEQADTANARTIDHLTRQTDPSCAINGSTRGFALLVPDGKSGRLLDLDEGGNTLAMAAFQSSTAGQKILSGQGVGEKPLATIFGTPQGDQLVVKTIRLESRGK